MNSRNNIRGSLWSKWDLHFHTPASFDYGNNTITNVQIVDKLIESDVSVVAITDHHTMDVNRIAELQKLGIGKLTILPGIELRSDQGSKPIHYICIFAEDADLDYIWTKLQGALNLTRTDIDNVGGDDRIYVPIEDAHEIVSDLGGIISIHAGEKSNTIEEIKNNHQFQQRIKYDILNKYIDLLEIGQLKDIVSYKDVVFPITGLQKPLIIGSDNHNILSYFPKTTTWIKADPTFRGLLMVLQEPSDRVYIGDIPPDNLRWSNNRTKLIDKILFVPKPNLPAEQKWFSGEILLNPGLVAIIGNKGSGKSALSDTLGLLGASKNNEHFSFLSNKRFRDHKNGYAHYFEANLFFQSGESFSKGLDENVKPEEAERIKYLPQDHIENICNELSISGETSFEKELKTVIYSHVPKEKRYGQTSIDKLIDFSAIEKIKRIEALKKSLFNLNIKRSELDIQSDPSYANSVKEQIKKKDAEITAHESIKPVMKDNPKKSGTIDKEIDLILTEIKKLEDQNVETELSITEKEELIQISERRHAVANRLFESISNFEEDYKTFKNSVNEYLNELSIRFDDIIEINFKTKIVRTLIETESTLINKLKGELNSTDPIGLYSKRESLGKEIDSLKIKLDAPNIEYQKSLSAMKVWEKKKMDLEGDANNPESLKGLKFILDEITELPIKISELQLKQIEMAKEIFTEKKLLASLYQELYEPVQNFINSHIIARDKLKLEFKAELMDNGFITGILPLIAQNKRGSFLGVEDGKIRMECMLNSANMDEWDSVKQFIESVDEAFHYDLRDLKKPTTLLLEQLVKGKKPVDIYNILFALDYIAPRYMLKWDGKDLSMLSPGERGTLLLIFYLLIDKSDYPIIIDQPEGNLDNHTVAKILVDCIRYARQKRQVCIVTHNPNLAVVCDADQVIRASLDIENGNQITYLSGSLENPVINLSVTEILEGTRPAFNIRGSKYEIAE